MRILHIVNGLGTGGAEKLIVDIVPLIVNKGNEVDVLLLNRKSTPFLRELKRLKCCKIFFLGCSFYNPLYIFQIIPYLRKYDLVHVHLFPSMYFVALAKFISFSKTKLIFTEHNTSNRRLQNRLLYPLERFIYSQYHTVICITEGVKQALLNRFRFVDEKFQVLENGVDILRMQSAVAYSRTEFGYQPDDKILCMVAGFRIQKDQDSIVRALDFLPPQYKVIFVGDGERRDEVRQLALDLGVDDRINFMGVRTDVYRLLKMCDISILSSHWEGFGLVAVEGMACGIPLIASNVEGLAQVVSDGGLLFEKGNVKDLVNKIQSLENPQLYAKVSANGLDRAKKYDLAVMIDKIISLYRNVVTDE
ncbi:glycosyltransferase family 4 protein [Sphingobacterium faecium]|uniref:glycosyltransferase family 4 protein n=1 Tax=Sphingobacterium faecium TaxID=34087 RepID=UPI00320B46FA